MDENRRKVLTLNSGVLEVRAGESVMGKIRINELARELEVKPNVIIDMLPELGVHDKKTHSSSLDADVALQLRQLLTGETREASGGSRGDTESERAGDRTVRAEAETPATEHSSTPHTH